MEELERFQQFLIKPSEQRANYSHRCEANASTKTATLWVGNLSFYTTEEQIYELFSKCGEIRRIIMGLNAKTKTPCGFCFVEFYTHQDAADCARWVNGAMLDDRLIKTSFDVGFEEGRQYGRGRNGGQIKDDFVNFFNNDFPQGEKEGEGEKVLGKRSPRNEEHFVNSAKKMKTTE